MRTAFAAVAVALAAALPAPAGAQPADAYPSRPIRMIQPFSAGSGPDMATRFVAKGMAERLGQNVVVENRVGAVGVIGMQELARSAPDGYTLGYANLAIGVSQWLLSKGAFNLARDVVPVGPISFQYNVLVVSPKVEARTVDELVAMLKAKPGAYSYGSGGNGTPAHLNGDIFRRTVGLDVVHVPYKGLANAVNDMARGDVHYMFGISASMMAPIRQGRLRAIAVAAPKRLAALPDVPTMEEAGYRGLDVRSWAGFVAPAGTPAPVLERLRRALAEVLGDPATHAFLEGIGADVPTIPPAEFGELLKTETVRWEQFIRDTGLKAD